MKKIERELNEKLNQLVKVKTTIEKRARAYQPGYLKINYRGNSPRCYAITYDEGKKREVYISKKQSHDKIKRLAQQDYEKSIIKKCNKQIEIIDKCLAGLDEELLENSYWELPEIRRKMVMPLIDIPELIADQWEESANPGNPYFPEGLRYETDRGELVRSKSEVIIANYLNKNRDKLYYKYEYPLKLNKPRNTTVYPDFTIMVRKNARVCYLEHAGMLGIDAYADEFVKKSNLYLKNGLYTGENMFFTMETENVVLDINSLKTIVDRIISE